MSLGEGKEEVGVASERLGSRQALVGKVVPAETTESSPRSCGIGTGGGAESSPAEFSHCSFQAASVCLSSHYSLGH